MPKRLEPMFSYGLGTPLAMVCEGFSQEVGLMFRRDKLDFCEACFNFRDKHYHLTVGLEEDENLYLKLVEAFAEPMSALMTVREVWLELSAMERKLYEVKE